MKPKVVGGKPSIPTGVPYVLPALWPLLVPVKGLKLDPKNAREHDKKNLDAIAKSLGSYKQRTPLVVQREGMVVRKGNGTLMAALKLGWKQIAAVVVDEDDVQATSYAISDNRTGELSVWSYETLGALIQEYKIDPLEGLAGFGQLDVGKLLMGGFTRDNFESELVEGGFVKPPKEDGCWFYVEFYGEKERFTKLKAKLGPRMKTTHQLDGATFSAMIDLWVKHNSKPSKS